MNLDNQIKKWAKMILKESMGGAVVYFEDGSKQELKDIHSLESFVLWQNGFVKYNNEMTNGEGDIPKVKSVVIDGKEYTADDIEKFEMDDYMDDDSYKKVSDEKESWLATAIRGNNETDVAEYLMSFLGELYSIVEPEKRSEVSKLLKEIGNELDVRGFGDAMNNAWNFVARNG